MDYSIEYMENLHSRLTYLEDDLDTLQKQYYADEITEDEYYDEADPIEAEIAALESDIALIESVNHSYCY